MGPARPLPWTAPPGSGAGFQQSHEGLLYGAVMGQPDVVVGCRSIVVVLGFGCGAVDQGGRVIELAWRPADPPLDLGDVPVDQDGVGCDVDHRLRVVESDDPLAVPGGDGGGRRGGQAVEVQVRISLARRTVRICISTRAIAESGQMVSTSDCRRTYADVSGSTVMQTIESSIGNGCRRTCCGPLALKRSPGGRRSPDRGQRGFAG